MMYDVIIIGAGVSGSASAREISRYKVNACVLEKAEDVCCGTSKANSAIVHAGFDAHPGSLKARFNVEGNLMMGDLSKDLDFDFDLNGSLVLCLHEEDMPALKVLYVEGVENGVKDLSNDPEENEVSQLEPNIADRCVAALYAPTGGIVCPFESDHRHGRECQRQRSGVQAQRRSDRSIEEDRRRMVTDW